MSQLKKNGETLVVLDESKDKIFDKKEVDRILRKVKGEKKATVSDVKRSKRNQAPPTPFNLTTLQSNLFTH